MRVLTGAGGTGGGVYPALTVLQALKGRAELLWLGGEGGMEAELVQRSGIPFQSIPAAGVHGVGPARLPGNLLRLARGYMKAVRIIRDFKPDVLFFTGGYVAVPIALAGRRIPTLLYVPDVEPGLALKAVAGLADRIALTCEASLEYFRRKDRLVVSGYPTRGDLVKWDRASGRREFGLSAAGPVLLVAGGSRGARSINRAVTACLPDLLRTAEVIHICGPLDHEEMKAAAQGLDRKLAKRFHLYPYLHEQMGAALAAADLVLSRAGASTLGEYPLFGLPAVLVPYPHAWRYQKVNANHLAAGGAALILEDGELTGRLLPTVQALLGDSRRLAGMRAASLKLRQPQAAGLIAGLLLELAGERR